MRKPNIKTEDFIGYKKGNIEVIGAGIRNKEGKRFFEVKCYNCGAIYYQTIGNLLKVKGDGCKNCKNSYLKTHGMKYEKIYNVWKQMKHRCNCTENDYNHYKNYGGRGIKVCDEWNKSFEAFRDWAYANGWNEENMYSSGRNMLTVDRIDNNGDYCPENCRIITHKEQQYNKRNTRYITLNGTRYTYKDLMELTGLPLTTIKGRIRHNWTFEELKNIPRNGTRKQGVKQ